MRKLCRLAIILVTSGIGVAGWAGQPAKPSGERAQAPWELAQYTVNPTDVPSEGTQIITNPESASQAIVTIRSAICKPEEVRPGETVTVEMEYSVTAPRNSPPVSVEESWILEKDENVLTKFSPRRVLRSVGRWLVDAKIPIPQGAEPGAYFVVHQVQAGESYDRSGSFFFVVEPEKAGASRSSRNPRSGQQ
jgi:hypothetical protein